MEPTSSAVSASAAMGAVAFTSLLPGVNGDALIGAFAGAVVFALHAKDIVIAKRLVYMVVSFAMGYFGAPEVMRLTGAQSYTYAAFGASASVVTVALWGIDWIKRGGLSSFLGKREG